VAGSRRVYGVEFSPKANWLLTLPQSQLHGKLEIVFLILIMEKKPVYAKIVENRAYF
jgi:hypothetical protein